MKKIRFAVLASGALAMFGGVAIAIHMERVKEDKVDWESFWTTLTFEIP